MSNFFSALLISLLIGLNSSAQSTKKVDSLQKLLGHPSLLKQTDALNSLALLYANTDSTKAFNYATKAREISIKTKYLLGIGQANRAMGIAQSFRYREKNALEHLNIAISYFQKINRTDEIGMVYSDMGTVFKLHKDQKTALTYFQKAEAIHLANKDNNKLIGVYNNLGACYAEIGLKTKAVENYIKGLKLAEKLKQEEDNTQLILNLGNVMQSEKNYDEANKYYYKAITIFKKQNNHLNTGISYLNLANSYILMKRHKDGNEILNRAIDAFEKANFVRGIQICYNNLGALFLRQNQFSEAIPFLQKSLDIIKSSPNKAGQALVEQNIGYAYTKLDNLTEAEKWFEKSENSAKHYKSDINVYAEIYTHRAMLDSAKGDYYNALIRKSQAIKIKDSLLNDKLNLQINELQTKYETEKKQSQINFLTTENTIQSLSLKNQILALNSSKLKNERNQLEIQNKNLDLEKKNATIQQKELQGKNDTQQINLLNKQATIQQLKIAKRNQTILILAGGTLLLAVISYLYFNKRKLQQQAQMQKDIQNEKERIARDLHDNVGGQLSYIIYSLDGINHEDEQTRTEITENINQSVRNVVGSLRETIWAISDANIKISDLSDKLKVFTKTLFRHTDTKISFTEKITIEKELNALLGLNVYRVCQEILNNAFKHSRASIINIEINSLEEFFSIQISDNGIGFDMKDTSLGKNSYGLANIKKRTSEFGIKLNLITEPKKGTTYILSL